jgi:cytochrome P450 family 4
MWVFGRKCATDLKASYQHWFYLRLNYNVIRAKDAEKILGSSKHINKSLIYNFLHPFLKTGLLTSNGEKWHKRRRMLTPTFHFDILKEFHEMFKEESDKLVEQLKGKINTDLDIIPISTQFTLNTICGEIFHFVMIFTTI